MDGVSRQPGPCVCVQVQGHGTHEAKIDGASRRPGPCVCVQVEGHGTHETKMDGASRQPGPCVCVQVQEHGTNEAKMEKKPWLVLEDQKRVLRLKVLGISGDLANLQHSLSDPLTALAAHAV